MPGAILKSWIVLSSLLHSQLQRNKSITAGSGFGWLSFAKGPRASVSDGQRAPQFANQQQTNSHGLSSKDQPLLDRRDASLLLDALLDLGNLASASSGTGTHLPLGLDIDLDLHVSFAYTTFAARVSAQHSSPPCRSMSGVS